MNTNTNQFDAKDATRIADIRRKSNGNVLKARQLATTMAEAITKADKALRRYRAAEDVNEHDLAQIFYRRYQALTSIDYRSYGKREQLAAIPKPLPRPDPDMEIKIKSVKFVAKETPSARPRVYFWSAGTSNLGEMFMQRYTPKQVFMPRLDDVLRPVGMTVDTAPRTGAHARRAFVKARWSQHAGCTSCPCSPGFLLNGMNDSDEDTVRNYEFDIHVDYVVVSKS